MYSLCRCIEADESILSTVSPSVPIRLANNLIEVVAMLIDVGDYATEMKIPSVAPWILLFSVIHLSVFIVVCYSVVLTLFNLLRFFIIVIIVVI